MTTFTLIQVGNTVFDKEQSIKGIVTSIDYTTNVAQITTDSPSEDEVILCKLANLVIVKSTVHQSDGIALDYNKWSNWVKEFQIAFGHPAPDKPTMLSKERIIARNSWMDEECEELLEAETLEDQVDAALDKLFFALGDLVELGVEPHHLLEIVQNANMGKLHMIDGKLTPVYKEDGKVKKPDDWNERFAPEAKLKAEIERQLKLK